MYARGNLGGQLPAVADSSSYARPIFFYRRMLLHGHICLLLGLSFIGRWYSVVSMLGRIVALSSIASMCALFFIWQTATPATIGPVGILFVFIFMYLSALGLLTFFLFGLSKL